MARAKTRKAWTTSEEALLRELYPKHLAKDLVGRFPGRTIESIKYRACILGIRSAWLWTEEEDRVLREEWPAKGTVALRSRFGGKSDDAIRRRASNLGLRRLPKQPEPEPEHVAPWFALMRQKIAQKQLLPSVFHLGNAR